MHSLFYTAMATFVAGTVASNACPNATIDSGIVIGTTKSVPGAPFTVNQFLGIPFAASPVHFKPPQPPIPWSEPYNATSYKPSCIQQFDYPEEQRNLVIKLANTPPPPAGECEDCLNLNVYTPQGGEDGKAVLFWLYGGSFSSGSGTHPLYHGTSFAAHHDVVVVTSNYRTNIFGFPGSNEIPEHERNLGLLDQRLALDWVRRNIASFNGNPERVTIFGESDGASSVDALITLPPDPIPFRAAILQSGQITLGGGKKVSEATASWNRLVNATDCPEEDALECIRGKPASRLKDIVEQLALPFGPIQDGVTVSKSARQNRLNSKDDASLIARVPVLIGTNANEASMYVIGQNDTATFLRWAVAMLDPWYRMSEEVEKEKIQEVLDAYPLSEANIETELDRIERIVTDILAQCKAKVLADESQSVEIPTYRYYFDASFPNSELFNGSGAYHAAEIQMVFGTYKTDGSTEFQMEVSRRMQKAWADFAKDPTVGPGWNQVPEVGVFGGGVRAGEAVRGRPVFALADKNLDKTCELWQALYK